MKLIRPAVRSQTSSHTFSVARETVEKAERDVCEASAIARVPGCHEAAAEWCPIRINLRGEMAGGGRGPA